MIVRVYPGFADLPSQHKRQLEELAKTGFLTSEAWFRNLIATALPSHVEVRLYAVEEPSEERPLRCLFPARTPAARRGYKRRRMPSIGSDLSSLTNEKTVLFSPIITDPDADHRSILRHLARYLRTERPRWSFIDLPVLDEDATSTKILREVLVEVGYSVKTYHSYVNCYEPVCRSFASYRSKLPRSSRQNVSYYLSKYRRLTEAHRARIEVFEDASRTALAIRDFSYLYEISWKPADIRPDYLSGLIETGLESEAVQLMILYIDNEPAATSLVLLDGQRGVFYRTAYNPHFASYSPGAILTAKVIERLIERKGVVEIDYGRDAEAYKKTWVRHRRNRIGMVAFDGRTLGGLIGLGWYNGAALVRKAVDILRRRSGDNG